jgi:hypothetical protein
LPTPSTTTVVPTILETPRVRGNGRSSTPVLELSLFLVQFVAVVRTSTERSTLSAIKVVLSGVQPGSALTRVSKTVGPRFSIV